MSFLDMKHFREIRNIQELELLDESLSWAIRYNGASRTYYGRQGFLEITLFKRKGWLAIPVSDIDSFTQTFQQQLYEALISHKYFDLQILLLDPKGFAGYSGTPTMDSLEEFRFETRPYYSVLFSGVPEPDFAIISIVSDYYIVAGEADFIYQVFGSDIQARFSQFQDFAMSEGSDFFKEQLTMLCNQLKDEYEKAEVGTEFRITP
ncbi:MAG: hypothetical protein SAJ12_22795 [Jaaginema sp. PMC 1079.18]|nr:hypothetical protein [Jaaginema sp. PMC 1080.18]MEC4853819.1 hypothetical protein [Jaaginema sp. PMC 1079.18]MEC4869095.1 hypothetical protein [Jaaginema sp. PMC 1078.18]